MPSALKLVGDRHGLDVRQRKAVQRCACTDDERAQRLGRRLHPGELRGRSLAVDAFNCVIVTESVRAGAVVLRGRDGATRDLAGVHGAWRRMHESAEAVRLLGRLLRQMHPSEVHWYVDRPVSNSGRLAEMLREQRSEQPWLVELVDRVDEQLADCTAVVATADGWVLDRSANWVDLPAAVAGSLGQDAWLVELG
jgi:hypothetical protein